MHMVYIQVFHWEASKHCFHLSGYVGPSGVKPPQIGPDPARIKQFFDIQPITTVKRIMSFLGMDAELNKSCPDYVLTTNKLMSLLSRNTKFYHTDS